MDGICSMPLRNSFYGKLAIRAALAFIAFAQAAVALGQHGMPVPTCPGRGLVSPGADGLWYLDGCYGCPMDAAIAESEEDANFHILPLEWHEYQGITAEYIYTGEVFSLARGGFNTNRATRYRGNLDLVLAGDTEAMDLWEGGRFFAYGNSYHGQALTSNYVGDAQFFSNIDSTPRSANEFLLMEYWYEHAFADGDIMVKVGKQDSNADFAFVDLGGDFVNSSFGFSPTIPLTTWPNTGMGVATFVNLTDTLHYKGGVYDGTTSFGLPTGGQAAFSTIGTHGAITLQEFSWSPQLGADGDLPGTYRAGVWYHSHTFDDLASGVGKVQGNHGYWLSGDQMVWKEAGSDDEPQGLGIFVQYGWSPADRNYVNEYNGAGLTYRGLIPQRHIDLFGVGIASAGFSAAETTRETDIELFYKAQVTEWATLQPDLVYICNPSGNGTDALLVGLRTEIVF